MLPLAPTKKNRILILQNMEVPHFPKPPLDPKLCSKQKKGKK